LRDSELDWLMAQQFEPLFWTPEGLGRPSTWWSHVPFAFWLVAQCKPRLLIELGTHDGVSYTAFCEAVSRLKIQTRCYAVNDSRFEDKDINGDILELEFEEVHSRRYGAFSHILRQSFASVVSGVGDHTIDLLHVAMVNPDEPLLQDFDQYRLKFSDRAVVLLHGVDDDFGELPLSRFFGIMKRQAPTFEFLHGRGLGIIALGSHASAQVKRLCDLSDGHEITRVRERFAHLGARWETITDARIAGAEAGGTKGVLAKAQNDLAAATTEIAKLRERALAAATDSARLSDSLQTVTGDLERLVDHQAANFEREHTLLRELGQSQRRKQRVVLPPQLRGVFALLSKRKRRLRRNYRLLATSPLFDRGWYLMQNDDVEEARVDPILHFLLTGGSEGRQPGLLFNTDYYLAANPDVSLIPENPLIHFLRWGARESRPLGLPLPAQFALSDRFAELDISSMLLPSEPKQHAESVDLVICAHNAYEDVQRCLNSVITRTSLPYRLIIVDDGSHEKTRDYLANFAETQGAHLIRHENARGYTLAANAGLQACTGEFCVLLNSDTEVSTGWIDRLLDYMRRDPEVGIVGPLSNTASWQSIPELSENGDWAQNELPQELDVEAMARIVSDGAHRRGIPLGFINGFCLLLRRRMLEAIGLFDGLNFGTGYGEENDLCIRARKARWKLLVADDCFVFHFQSMSYGIRRYELARRSGEALAKKHNAGIDIDPYVHICKKSFMTCRARLTAKANIAISQLTTLYTASFVKKTIAFILPIAEAGGGGNVIVQEMEAMRRLGAEPYAINDLRHKESFEKAYPNCNTIYFGANGESSLAEVLQAKNIQLDLLVATTFRSFSLLPNDPRYKLAYYIQDMENRFFEAGDPRAAAQALATYRNRPEVVRITKSEWNKQQIVAVGGFTPQVVGPSVDVKHFFPRSDARLGRHHVPRITAMVRPDTPRRGPERTLRVLRRLKDKFGAGIWVDCFGGTYRDLSAFGIPLSGIRVWGKLTPNQVAELLGRTDMFLDLSDWQAMGLTTLEAMASGAAVIVPQNGGTTEFCIHGESGIVLDGSDEDAYFNAASALIRDSHTRFGLGRKAMEVASVLSPEVAAYKFLNCFWNEAPVRL
jgi:GT2 family glycosyltransferase/glycosyltransferase involved in cell wall biosynthesis